MKSRWIVALSALGLLASTLPARADVAPDPCMGKKAGDACTTPANKSGTCVASASAPSGLTCQEGAGSSSASSGSGAGGGSGGNDDKGGCAYGTGAGAVDGWGALSLLAAIPLLARRRRSAGESER
jgi:hypothetical protein